jgi:capsular exopolysaccharide synthesis family protein
MRNRKHKFDQRGSYLPITRIEPNSIISEQYRKLRTNIELSDFNKNIQIVGITSTNQMEGKTLTAINLAEVYAQSGKKTLLIDMDLRKPKIHRGFRIINKKGLSDIFTKDYDITDVVEHVEANLDVLPSGSKLPYPAEFLSSEQLKTFVGKLKDVYERIIIDTPPMTAVADASIISSFCDGMLLVIASRETEIHITKDVIKDLENNGAHIIGSVLTRVSKRDSRYMNYYYYQYH